MLFSSVTFIYYFLPILLLVYFIVPKKLKNTVLLIFSLLFYFLGEPRYLIILLLSCVLNYIFSKLIERGKYTKLFLILAIIYNVGQLFIFKYLDFFIVNINNVTGLGLKLYYLTLPIGISFFTFQAMSYVIDVYNKKHKSARSLWEFMTYISLFPQLIAGPIVRYSDVLIEFDKREHSFNNTALGIRRFIIGLGKKVLIANVFGELVREITEVSVLSSWIKPIAYTFQIYFDFSGYSDMAIGLGLMFGFHFKENFNYPLIASSITDFWRRWHISLSSWFRDYIYIPLGGNRVGKIKLLRNIFVVWFLTGFWHGASWNFILWGLYFAVILVIEKFIIKKYLDKTKVLKYIYSIILIIIGFLIFSVEDVNAIFYDLKNMFFVGNISLYNSEILYLLRNYLGLFIVAIIGATPLMKVLIEKINNTKFKKAIDILEPVFLILLLILVTAFLVDESFNPFLYFRF